jgi:Tol biopolymer transport system component
VAFQSFAHNLVSPDNNPMDDILVKNLTTGVIIRANTNASGVQANDGSTDPSISADGSKVAFISWASNLVVGRTYEGPMLFVKNIVDGSIAYVAGGVNDACISRDGQYVTFSTHDSLVPADNNGTNSIYRARTDGSDIQLVSADATGIADNGESLYSTISGRRPQRPHTACKTQVHWFESGCGDDAHNHSI